MVVFVNSEFYLSGYDSIRHSFRASHAPVQIFCGVSVDTCGACCVLLDLLKTDLVNFDVHPVHTYDDIHSVVKSHDIFREEDALECVFLNCGAAMSLPTAIDVDRCHVHIMDTHGPVHLDIVLCPSPTVYIWDAGSIQKDIERHFTRSLASQGKRGRDDDSEAQGGAEDFSWDLLSDLTPDDEARYYEMTFRGVSPSKILYDIAVALRATSDDELLWYRAVSLTDSHLDVLGSSEAYAADILRIQDAVIVSELSKTRHRRVVLKDVNSNTEDVVTVGSFHKVQVENISDHRLLLLSHWTLWDAIRHSPYTSHRLNLMSNDSIGTARLKDLLAHIGVTVKTSQTQWTELPSSRREEILRLLASEGARLYGIQRLAYRSVAKRHGYSYWCAATDMVHLLHHTLTDPDTRTSFLRCMEILQTRNVQVLQTSMAAAVGYHRALFEQSCALLQKNMVTTLKSFHYVFLSDDDVPTHYLSPVALRTLASYIIPTMPKGQKARPLVIGALDAAKSHYVLVGSGAMAPHFARASQAYPSIVQHFGVDTDWITVHKDQCVFVLEAIHLGMIAGDR